MNQRGSKNNLGIVLQAASLILPAVLFWVDIEQRDGKQSNVDAIAVEHRLSALESDMKGLQNRVETMSQWLRQRGK